MGRGAWKAAVHGVAKESGTTDQLKQQQQLKPVCLDNQNPTLLDPVSWSYMPALFPSQESLLCWRADNLPLNVVASQVPLGAAGVWAVSGHRWVLLPSLGTLENAALGESFMSGIGGWPPPAAQSGPAHRARHEGDGFLPGLLWATPGQRPWT